jgi:hypothetical protein
VKNNGNSMNKTVSHYFSVDEQAGCKGNYKKAPHNAIIQVKNALKYNHGSHKPENPVFQQPAHSRMSDFYTKKQDKIISPHQ